MKKFIQYIAFATLAIALMQACGKQKMQNKAAQSTVSQTRQDSLARAQAEKDAKKAEEMMQQKQPQPAKTTQTPKQQTPPPADTAQVNFDSQGKYAIQVGSWRSVDFAAKRKDIWKKRGFNDAYVVKFGSDSTGNVWFRVRLGRLNTKEMAQKEQEVLKQKYNVKSWVSVVGNMK